MANSSGVYIFAGLANGSYTVTPTKNGYVFSPASQQTPVVRQQPIWLQQLQ